MIKGIEIVYQGKKFTFTSETEYQQEVELKMNIKFIIPVAIKGKDKVCVHREPAEGLSLLNHDWELPWKCKAPSCQNQAGTIQNVLFFRQLYDIRQGFDASKQIVTYIRGLAFLYPTNKQEIPIISEIQEKQFIFLELFYSIYQRGRNTQCLKRMLGDYKQNTLLNSKCLISNLPTKIPVRHRSCQHFDCYDLFSLALLQKSRKQQDLAIQFKCYQKDCNVVYDITTFEQMKGDLFLDVELFQILNKHPLCQTLYYQDQLGQLQPYKKNIEIGQQIFIKANNLDNNAKIEDKYQRQFNYLCNQELSQQFFQKINYVQTDFMTNLIIEYPTKCKQCKEDKYLDLSSFIFHLLQQINDDFMENNKESGQEIKATCPICLNVYEDNKNQKLRAVQMQPQLFHSNIIINNHLLRAIRGLQQNELNINGQIYFLDYLQNQLCLQDKQSLDILFKGKQLVNNCVYSNKQLVNPLLLIKCPERNHIEFDEFFKLYLNIKDKESLKLCKCQACTQETNQFLSVESSLLFNQYLSTKLNGNQKQNRFNFDDEQYIQTPRIESVQDKLIKQNPLIGSIRYQKQFMVDQEQYQGIKIKKITTNVGAFHEEATQINYQSNIDKAGIQEQQSANKYGIKIKGIDVITQQTPDVQKYRLK
ncbi:hypothetical protein pb186bvf_013046 [Paramecium bursaria]